MLQASEKAKKLMQVSQDENGNINHLIVVHRKLNSNEKKPQNWKNEIQKHF